MPPCCELHILYIQMYIYARRSCKLLYDMWCLFLRLTTTSQTREDPCPAAAQGPPAQLCRLTGLGLVPFPVSVAKRGHPLAGSPWHIRTLTQESCSQAAVGSLVLAGVGKMPSKHAIGGVEGAERKILRLEREEIQLGGWAGANQRRTHTHQELWMAGRKEMQMQTQTHRKCRGKLGKLCLRVSVPMIRQADLIQHDPTRSRAACQTAHAACRMPVLQILITRSRRYRVAPWILFRDLLWPRCSPDNNIRY